MPTSDHRLASGSRNVGTHRENPKTHMKIENAPRVFVPHELLLGLSALHLTVWPEIINLPKIIHQLHAGVELWKFVNPNKCVSPTID